MGRRFRGCRVYAARLKGGVTRPGQWFGKKDVWYYLSFGDRLLQFVYRPFQGCIPISLSRVSGHEERETIVFPDVRSKAMKRVSVGAGDSGDDFPLNCESKIFGKLPNFLAFLTVKKYDDGSPRKPGRIWLESDGVAYTLTLFEGSAYARVRLRAASIDDAYAAAEKHLASDNPPWEPDDYARQRDVEKKKKK